MTALSPGEQVIKILRDELVEILGKDNSAHEVRLSSLPRSCSWPDCKVPARPPRQASWRIWFKAGGHRPLLVSVDVYRPAAREQLKVVAQAVKAQIYEGHVADESVRPPSELRRR